MNDISVVINTNNPNTEINDGITEYVGKAFNIRIFNGVDIVPHQDAKFTQCYYVVSAGRSIGYDSSDIYCTPENLHTVYNDICRCDGKMIFTVGTDAAGGLIPAEITVLTKMIKLTQF